MIVGTLRIQLVLRGCRSLKEKRRVIKGLKSTLSGKFNIAVAETENQDVWQSAEIGVVTVGPDHNQGAWPALSGRRDGFGRRTAS